jgi:hypothetical protein
MNRTVPAFLLLAVCVAAAVVDPTLTAKPTASTAASAV